MASELTRPLAIPHTLLMTTTKGLNDMTRHLGDTDLLKRYRKEITDGENSRAPKWFLPDTLRFWNTKFPTGVLNTSDSAGPSEARNLFVTSDRQYDDSDAFTIRQFVVEDGVAVDIKTIGEFGAYETLDEALVAIINGLPIPEED